MRFLRHLGKLMKEFLGFAWQNKAWWIVPVVLTLLLLTALVVVGQGVVPQFIYTIW
jgi:K+-transporting ATPase A subunit